MGEEDLPVGGGGKSACRGEDPPIGGKIHSRGERSARRGGDLPAKGLSPAADVFLCLR